MATLCPYPRLQFWTIADTGMIPVSGGKLYHFVAGDDTPQAVYGDKDETVVITDPIILTAEGFVGTGGLWLGTGKSYKLVLTDADDNTLWTIDNVSGGSGVGDGTILTVDSIAELRALDAAAAAVVIVNGYYERGDRGGGLFTWQTGATEDDDNGIWILPDSTPATGRWMRQYQGAMNVRWFGAYGDGIEDDSVAIAYADAYADDNLLDLLFDDGTYHVTALNLTCRAILEAGAVLEWEGINPTITAIIGSTDNGNHFDCSLDDAPSLISPYIRPEWFADANNLALAIAAVGSFNTTVQLSVGQYRSPHIDDNAWVLKDEFISIVGAGRPIINAANNALTGGSVILGCFHGDADGLQLRNLGIDCGSSVCAAYYSAAAQNGLVIDNSGGSTPPAANKGIVIENVAVLCKAATSDVNAVELSNVQNLIVSNLLCQYGVNGVYLRGILATLDNITCKYNNTSGLTIENYDVEDGGYGLAHDIVVNNLNIYGMAEVSTGIVFKNSDATGTDLYNVSITGVNGRNLKTVLEIVGDSGSRTIKNVSVVGTVISDYVTMSSYSGNYDKDTILLGTDLLFGDNATFIGASKLIIAADSLDLGATEESIKILNQTSSTAPDPLVVSNYAVVGRRRAEEVGTSGVYETFLDLEKIGTIGVDELTSPRYLFTKNDVTSVMTQMIPVVIGLGPGGSVVDGIEMTVVDEDDGQNATATRYAGYCYSHMIGELCVLNVAVDIALSTAKAIKYVDFNFVGENICQRPSVSIADAALAFPASREYVSGTAVEQAVYKVVNKNSPYGYFRMYANSQNPWNGFYRQWIRFSIAYPLDYPSS